MSYRYRREVPVAQAPAIHCATLDQPHLPHSISEILQAWLELGSDRRSTSSAADARRWDMQQAPYRRQNFRGVLETASYSPDHSRFSILTSAWAVARASLRLRAGQVARERRKNEEERSEWKWSAETTSLPYDGYDVSAIVLVP